MSEYQDEKLGSGIFWVISDSFDLADYKLVYFKVHCDKNGNVVEEPVIPLNSNKGNSYKHKKTWDDHVKNNPLHDPYSNKDFNYYLRGRVSISNNRAEVHMHRDIAYNSNIFNDVRGKYGLFKHNIHQIRVIENNSVDNLYFIDELRAEDWRQNYCKRMIERSKFGIYAVLVSENLRELKDKLGSMLFRVYPEDVIDNLSVEMTEEAYVEFREHISERVNELKESAIRDMIKNDETDEKIKELQNEPLSVYFSKVM